MRRSIFCSIGVLLISLFLVASCAAPGQGPMTWLDRPLDGSHLPLGPVTILAHASDADGVASFEFSIDEDPLATVPASGGRLGDATAGWTPTEPGTYTVRARATDSAGNVGSEATSVVTVGELPTPSPTVPAERDEGEILFLVEPELIAPGACAVLRWEVNPPVEALLDGEGVTPAGEREVCPPETISYELAVPEWGQARSVTLHVEGAPEEVGIFFVVDPDAIAPGGCATLIWEVGAPAEWTTLVEGSEVPHTGQQQVCPASTTTYELAVEAPDGFQTTRTVTLQVESAQRQTPSAEPSPRPTRSVEPSPQPTRTTVAPPAPTSAPGCAGAPVISYFRANPSTINAGETTTLEWGKVTNGNSDILVASVIIEPGLGEVGSPGSRQVSPNRTTTYVMTATGCGGPATAEVTVVVNPASPTPSGTDLALTDLYAQSLHGPLGAELTNRGPGTINNATIQISCQWTSRDLIEGIDVSGQEGPIAVPIGNLSRGQTYSFSTGISMELPSYQYTMTCSIAVPFNDPNPGNNTHSETFTKDTPGGT